MKRILGALALAAGVLTLAGGGTSAALTAGAPGHGAGAAERLWQPFARGHAGTTAPTLRSSPGAWRVERAVSMAMPAGTLVAVSCPTPTSCVAVGSADSRGGNQTALVERLRAGRWAIDPVPAPEGATDAQLTAVSCPSAGTCIAVGFFEDGRGDIHTLAERWNGRTWRVAATPDPPGSAGAGLFAVSCASATGCTATGDANDSTGTARTLVERWDGGRWAIEPTPDPAGAIASGLFGVSCPGAGTCTAVGSFIDAAQTMRPLVEHLLRGAWVIQAAAAPPGAGSGFSAVACSGVSACLAVGQVYRTNGSQRPLAETWNGTTWDVSPAVAPADSVSAWLSGVSCDGAGRCTAAGQYDDPQRGHGLVEVWNGAAWIGQPVPDPAGTVGNGLSAVSCPASARCVAVGGAFRWQNPIGVTFAAAWNGAGWRDVATPNPTGAETTALLGVSCSSTGRCVAVGSYDTRAGTSRAFVETSTAGRWHRQAAPSPPGAITSTLDGVACPSATSCFAVGESSLQAETAFALVERWNGRRWRIQSVPLPETTFSDLVAVSCAAAGDCTAVGDYTTAAGNQMPLAEHWDGSAWTRERIPVPARTRTARLSGVACPGNGLCVAVGDDGTATGGHPLAERWNGTAWHLQHPTTTAGAFTAGFTAVSCSSADTCTAIGGEVNARDRMVTFAERWHPGSWSLQAMPVLPAAGRAELAGVSCGSTQSCVAVGDEVQSGPTLTLVETWDGRRWTATPTPLPPGTGISLLYGVSCPSADRCTAVGYRFGRPQIETALVIGRG